MFFQVKNEPATMDTYEQAKALITALLHYECPEHSPQHHLLYTTNQKLEQYRQAKDYYRKQIDVHTAIGHFSRQAYDIANQKFNQLYVLIRAYMHLADESKRAYFNHHLSFHHDKISLLYGQFIEQKMYMKLLNLEQAFWEALKEDLVPLFTQIE